MKGEREACPSEPGDPAEAERGVAVREIDDDVVRAAIVHEQ
jgi:hypothetical protein